MPAFEWKDTLRVVVGEITRGQQMAIWREIADGELKDLNVIDQQERIAEIVAAYATKSVSVRNGKGWKPVDSHVVIESDDVAIEFDLPLTNDGLSNMPLSLARDWMTTALEANGGLTAIINFISLPRTNSTQGSAITSESEPSSEAPTTD